MDYIVYKRFKGKGIGGDFNLPYGTIVAEHNGFLSASDGRQICAVTSENGWKHFRPNTTEGAHRQAMLDRLAKFYRSKAAAPYFEGDIYYRDLAPEENDYWLNILRTMETSRLENLYTLRIGGTPNV